MKLPSHRLWALLPLVSTVVRAQEGGLPAGNVTNNANYQCPQDTCVPPACLCASQSPPGGLQPKQVPQFITLTFDDSVNDGVIDVINNITAALNTKPNPNGCNPAATFFISTQWTDYWSVQRLFGSGHEIAVHTMTHVATPPLSEIQGSFKAVNAFAGVPAKNIVGFRTPFLAYDSSTFQNLKTAGTFLYDSSMEMNPINGYWPYTLDYGAATTCTTGPCAGSFKGLWEIPLYSLMNPDGTENAAMDPNPAPGAVTLTQSDIVALLKYNFLNHYNGTRLPFGMYLHAAVALPTIEAVRLPAYIEFIQWTQQFDDVYWVSNQQLLSWMLNPTDIEHSLVSHSLGCFAPATDPSNVEICDGIDNTGNGIVDAGLVSDCYFPSTQSSFRTCFGCPTSDPSTSNPVPGFQSPSTAGKFVPDTGCFNQTWDPKTGTCSPFTNVHVEPSPSLRPKPTTTSGTSGSLTSSQQGGVGSALGGGAIAGIVVGVVVAVAVVAAAVVFSTRRKRHSASTETSI
ncbi:uncharacterized protein BJ171DRAFT_562624 [Polychytrium aggregatum]|uniref:uncharacterized protein n=1 Tax=Polychytrium aggregatum TaxID=110093 RepID=UPI0022FE98E0|nr:uncharacterized protein BJ171DRAFT_562624 [Polychytrium aggregatum]KAI9199630.1 hypothetical protein BJ171DRAFT_562624 [Polychytrium aggregatum]